MPEGYLPARGDAARRRRASRTPDAEPAMPPSPADTPTLDAETSVRPELLYLLHGDPAELAEACAVLRPADIAEALTRLAPDAGAKVMAALPFDLAVDVFDQ